MIREMIEQDWESVKEIYLQGIELGIATFNTSCPSYESWDKSHTADCRYVYVEENKVVGWVALSPTSSRCVYKGSVEMSIYVSNEKREEELEQSLLIIY